MGVDVVATGQLNPVDSERRETTSAPGESEPTKLDDVVDYDESDDGDADLVGVAERVPPSRAPAPLLLALIAGLVTVVALGAVAGWLGYENHGAQRATKERALFLQAARQGARNLTTIGYEHADADVQRILDSAVGQFRDEFAQNAKPFVDTVKKAQSSSEGVVTESGLESVSANEAQAIVAVSVKTTAASTPSPQPRSWRMRLTMQKSGDDIKISNVGFIS